MQIPYQMLVAQNKYSNNSVILNVLRTSNKPRILTTDGIWSEEGGS